MYSSDSPIKAAEVPQVNSLEEHPEGQVHMSCKYVFRHTNMICMMLCYQVLTVIFLQKSSR